MPESPFDNPKVMDVNRPGRGRVMPTSSRPVVAPVVSNEASDGSINVDHPSTSHKVINPLNDIEDSEKNEELEDLGQDYKDTVPTEDIESSETAIATDDIPEEEDKQDDNQKDLSPEVVKEETEEKTKPVVDVPSPEKIEAADQNEVSDAAGVNALAANTSSKREAQKLAEDELKKNEEVAGLIASKEFNVSIGNASSGGAGKKAIYALVGLVVLAGVSMAVYMFLGSGSI